MSSIITSPSRGLGRRPSAVCTTPGVYVQSIDDRGILASNGVLAGARSVTVSHWLHPTTVDYLCGLSRNCIIEANQWAAPSPAVRMRSHLLQTSQTPISTTHHPPRPSPLPITPFGKPCSSLFSSRPRGVGSCGPSNASLTAACCGHDFITWDFIVADVALHRHAPCSIPGPSPWCHFVTLQPLRCQR